MKHKIITYILLGVSMVVTLITVLPMVLFDCWPSEGALEELLCSGFYERYLEPIFWTTSVLSIVSIILLFVRREVFISWAKFAAFGFPIMLGILFYTHQTSNAGGFGLGGLISDEMLATAVLPPLFFIISLSIIIWRSWKLRRSR